MGPSKVYEQSASLPIKVYPAENLLKKEKNEYKKRFRQKITSYATLAKAKSKEKWVYLGC